MPFGQPVLDTATTQPNGTTKFCNSESLKLFFKKNKKERGGGGLRKVEIQKKKNTKWEPDASS